MQNSRRRPHAKSMSAGQLGLHVARVPGEALRFAEQNPLQARDFASVPQRSSLGEILNTFEERVRAVKSGLPQFDDARMQETWRMMQGEREVLAVPRARFLRDIMLNHWYQHRGQFSVCLRLLGRAGGRAPIRFPGFCKRGRSRSREPLGDARRRQNEKPGGVRVASGRRNTCAQRASRPQCRLWLARRRRAD
jgi:uncharacterized damage-inducible protein DinB